MPGFAFVDESRRRSLYLVTMVEVHAPDVDLLRRCVRELAQRGSQRTHFSAEGDRRRATILARYVSLGAEGSFTSTVFAAPYRGGDEQIARDLCLRALTVECVERRVSRLVLDSRTVDRDRLDRQTIAAVVRGAWGGEFEYSHMGSREEPLLSLPDAIGWAWGAGGHWRAAVTDVVTSVIRCDG